MWSRFRRLRSRPVLWLAIALLPLLSVLALAGQGTWREAIRERFEANQGGGSAAMSANGLHTLDYGGLQRSYMLYLPPGYDASRPLPLVIALHGGGGNAAINERMTGLSSLAIERTFILVEPNGTGPLRNALLTWNAGNCCGAALDNQVDDVGFIRALIDHISADYAVDPNQIYATGLSNGGMMSYRLACELSDKIAAIGPVAGAMAVPGGCHPKRPVSVMAFHGTADQHVRFNGGAPEKTIDRRHPRVDAPVGGTIAFWVKHDHCAPKPEVETAGHIRRELYTGCRDGSAVELVAIQGEGHTWPGGQAIRAQADKPTQEISASSELVDFFLAHPRQ